MLTPAGEATSVRGQRDVGGDSGDVFDFELIAEQLATINALDTGGRGGPEPADITLEAYGVEIPEV